MVFVSTAIADASRSGKASATMIGVHVNNSMHNNLRFWPKSAKLLCHCFRVSVF